MLEAKLSFDAPEAIYAPVLATWVFECDGKAALEDVLELLDQKTGKRLSELVEAGELTGKKGQAVLLHRPAGLKAERLLLLGAGKREKFMPADVRRYAGTAARYLKSRGLNRFAYFVRSLPASSDPIQAAQAAVEGVHLANFEPSSYQTDPRNKKEPILSVTLAGLPPNKQEELERAVDRGQIIGEAQNFARELVNEPGNRLTPRLFAERAVALAHEVGLQIDILDEARLRELKMGALLAVAQGSDEPPRLVVLRYEPKEWRNSDPVFGLVGKGITFDAGGISIKPSENMEKMKYDMAGGAAMLGAMRAVARLRPARKVIAVVPLSENLPSGRAQKPGDVQVAMSGTSIEVVNTDAEGRLVLADAIHYARQLGATHLVDAATLTGAIVVALGHVHAGAFTNNENFLRGFLTSARSAGENFWHMPLDDDYRENIRSEIADIRNIGRGRGAGAMSGAMFVKEFVGDTPWIHLDIAGTAWYEDSRPDLAKGPSGIGVRTLVHLVENFSAD